MGFALKTEGATESRNRRKKRNAAWSRRSELRILAGLLFRPGRAFGQCFEALINASPGILSKDSPDVFSRVSPMFPYRNLNALPAHSP